MSRFIKVSSKSRFQELPAMAVPDVFNRLVWRGMYKIAQPKFRLES